MIKIRVFCVFIAWFTVSIIQSQTVEISGVVIANADVENIHVINKTSSKFTTTNQLGEFKIQVKRLDTIVFSSVQYKLKTVVILPRHIKEQHITVYLTENINVLKEVVVGKILTGDLGSDVNNSEAERPIDFYDVGIPGFTGKPKTQNERRLFEADNGKFVYLNQGLGINFNKILNKISGRTKKLRERVRVESNTVLLNKIKANLSEDFFSIYTLDEELRVDFFYFCSEDENFEKRCKSISDIEVFNFLAEKIVAYKKNLGETKN